MIYNEMPERPTYHADLRALSADMAAGKVDTLVVLGGNPVFNAPGDVDFAAALAKVGTAIHLSLSSDETTAVCGWHAPMAHYLESWGDAEPVDGIVTVCQPTLKPTGRRRALVESLAQWSGVARNAY